MKTAVGVDGCQAGWFYFRRDATGITHGVASNIDNLVRCLPSQARVFIDMPIGLIEGGTPGRSCDVEARRLLGGRKSSSVFSAPCRQVLKANSYEEAGRISFNAIGKKLSKQTFNITAKIKQVDDFMSNLDRGIAMREVHPELCFWALNGRHTVLSRKKDEAGFEERMHLLNKYVPNIQNLVAGALTTYFRKDVARDDILDALVAMIVAGTSDDALQTVPAIPPTDPGGLPMEIVYTEHPNDRALCSHN